ncbi:hypothetical protein D3C80_1814150 [compost metagenome]
MTTDNKIVVAVSLLASIILAAAFDLAVFRRLARSPVKWATAAAASAAERKASASSALLPDNQPIVPLNIARSMFPHKPAQLADSALA